jgi:hypothetical protein
MVPAFHLYRPRRLDGSGVNRLWLGWLLSLIFFVCLPVTSEFVGVLEGSYFAPSDALCRPHHPLERPVVVGGEVAVPGGDTEVSEGFR